MAAGCRPGVVGLFGVGRLRERPAELAGRAAGLPGDTGGASPGAGVVRRLAPGATARATVLASLELALVRPRLDVQPAGAADPDRRLEPAGTGTARSEWYARKTSVS